MKSKIYVPNDLEFEEIVKNAQSYTDCLKALGLAVGGTSMKNLKKRIEDLNISIEHFYSFRNTKIGKYTLEDILVENSDYNRGALKKKLIEEGLLNYECSICGNKGEWNNLPLKLQLHHKNGINNDNRLENLEFLCPNCHSQTDNFSGKNNNKEKNRSEENWNYCIDCGKKIDINAIRCPKCNGIIHRVIERPSREELKKLIRSTPFTIIAKQYNVSDNAIRKWCNSYNLPRKSSEIKIISDEDWEKI